MLLPGRLIPYLPHIIGIVVTLVLTIIIVQYFSTIEDEPQRKKIVQQVTMIVLPPPPPPEPEIEEQIAEEEEVVQEMDEAMPDESLGEDVGNDLGLDADGSAGGDGFGLVARKGGRGLIGGGYGALVVQEINSLLVDDERLRNKEYTVILKIWISDNGDIERYKIDKRSGDDIVVSMLQSAIARLGAISEGPPLEIPQPLRLRIKSKI